MSFENSAYAANRALDGALLQAEARVQAARQEMIDKTMQTAFHMGRKFQINSHHKVYTSFTRLKEDFFLNSMPNQLENVDSANSLELVVHHAQGKLEVANRTLFDQALELAFKEGERYQALKLEKTTLSAENILLKNQIEDIEMVQQREWEAVIEKTEAKIQTIAFKIKTLIGELDFFSELNKDLIARLHKIDPCYNESKKFNLSAFINFRITFPAIDYPNLWKIAEECYISEKYSSLLQNCVLPYLNNCFLTHLKNLPDLYPKCVRAISKSHLQAVMSPTTNSSLAIPLHDFTAKCDALALKIAALKAENVSLHDQKEKTGQNLSNNSRSLQWVTYLYHLKPCMKMIDKLCENIIYENQLINVALPKRSDIEKISWKGAAEKGEWIKNHLDLLLSQIDEIAKEFK